MAAFSIDPATKRPRTKHGVCVWHRRSGKDSTAMLLVALPAIVFRPGNYFHIFPYFSQARRAIWQEESSFLDRIPPHWSPHRVGTEMFVELTIPGTHKKARYFLLGADDTATVSKLVGSNPLGVIYSEAAQIDRSVQALLHPALAANGGWELFVSTPRGKNWFHDLYRMALGHKDWFCELLTVEHTRRDATNEDGTPFVHPDGLVEDGGAVVPLEEIRDAVASGRMTQEEADQEYGCSWEGYAVGTIYGDLLRQARSDGRVKTVPYDPRRPVGVGMDIGRTDLTAIWFYQVDGSAICLVDYHAARGMDSSACIRFLKENTPYQYGRIVLPHDAKERRFQATRYETIQREFQTWFHCPVVIAERTSTELQVNTVRKMFRRLVFDELKCGREFDPSVPSGLDSLGNYSRRYDGEKREYGPPLHDKFSHGASALATLLTAWQEGLESPADMASRQSVTVNAFDPFAEVAEEQERPYAARG
jgi:hypothetical protein